MKRNRSLDLFMTFLKIGTFTFGGGYAMIPMIEREIAEKKQWISKEELSDMVAIAETTPGPIAVNVATFVGYKTEGKRGAICSTLGVVLPSFLIILALAGVYRLVIDNPYVQSAFWGIRIGVLALIAKAVVTMYRQCPKSVFGYIIGLSAFAAVTFTKISVLFVIVAAAVAGIVYQAIQKEEKS